MMSRNYTSEENNEDNTPRMGFTQYAETLNGRLAMIGFVSLLTIQVIIRHGWVNW